MKLPKGTEVIVFGDVVGKIVAIDNYGYTVRCEDDDGNIKPTGKLMRHLTDNDVEELV